MKESNSFEDAVKKTLIKESKKVKSTKITLKPKKKVKSNYVSEAMGYTGASTNISPISYSGGSGSMPPFSKANTNDRASSIDMRDIGKEESRVAKLNNKKPYPLETIIDFIASSGESLQNAKSLLKIALKKNNISLTDEQIRVLKVAQQAISTSLGNIVKAAKSIDSVNLN